MSLQKFDCRRFMSVILKLRTEQEIVAQERKETKDDITHYRFRRMTPRRVKQLPNEVTSNMTENNTNDTVELNFLANYLLKWVKV